MDLQLHQSMIITPTLFNIMVNDLHTWYPETEWLHVYTDASIFDRNSEVGAEVYCNLFSF